MIAMGAGKNKKSISQLTDQTDSGKLQQRNRIAPVMQFALAEEAHGRGHPTHPVGDAQVRQQIKCWTICFAYEMVKALDRYAAEVEMSGHSSRFRGRFDNVDLMAVYNGLICGCQSHHTRTNNYDLRHQRNPYQPSYSLIVWGGEN